ncbi:hypothetical protein LUZ60_010783 [Juncus effusus]|nr:hypothetical protein LUZ60_010783 [Juncus effusus]
MFQQNVSAIAGTALLLALGAWRNFASSSLMEDRADDTFHGGVHTPSADKRMIKIMTHNVWFQQDMKMHERMKAISDIIQKHEPDVIFFQEITPTIYKIFQGCELWDDYKCSLTPEKAKGQSDLSILLSKPPMNLVQPEQTIGRDLPIAEISISSKSLIVATTHLPRKGEIERMNQAKEAINILNNWRNVVFGGDMNWNEASDRLPPIQKRLDRFLCKLEDFRLVNVYKIGLDPIPRVSYQNETRKSVPVYPSDHYGLLLTIELK